MVLRVRMTTMANAKQYMSIKVYVLKTTAARDGGTEYGEFDVDLNYYAFSKAWEQTPAEKRVWLAVGQYGPYTPESGSAESALKLDTGKVTWEAILAAADRDMKAQAEHRIEFEAERAKAVADLEVLVASWLAKPDEEWLRDDGLNWQFAFDVDYRTLLGQQPAIVERRMMIAPKVNRRNEEQRKWREEKRLAAERALEEQKAREERAKADALASFREFALAHGDDTLRRAVMEDYDVTRGVVNIVASEIIDRIGEEDANESNIITMTRGSKDWDATKLTDRGSPDAAAFDTYDSVKRALDGIATPTAMTVDLLKIQRVERTLDSSKCVCIVVKLSALCMKDKFIIVEVCEPEE